MMLKVIRKKRKNWSLVEKKLPSEGCTGRYGEREKSSGQKKISDDKRHCNKDHMRRLRGTQKIGKSGECWICSERPALGRNTMNEFLIKKKKKKKKKKKTAWKGKCLIWATTLDGKTWLFNDAVSTTRLFSVGEIGDSEMVFGEMRPRIRHRLPGIHLTVGKTSEKTQQDNQPKRNFRPADKRLNRLSLAGGSSEGQIYVSQAFLSFDRHAGSRVDRRRLKAWNGSSQVKATRLWTCVVIYAELSNMR
ncbi:hypothetical protein ANN_08323 [Periplaneta americana]|uniref:Uncharacterized protein n=1 Tax=Periplaneta americana TaxID=6978 RepID=A0ABQ8T137_PERAM|nr:hypothetical protein ANN_08323 [Periplaneta americana]